ncbi:MAG TPA: response regulator [Geobacteraceae bacterium]|nr:response regulator [Geobacteraceae bacterium]
MPMTSISLLVVEDEAITLEYLVTTLAREFPTFALYQALNGRTGLELFRTHTPDIVITDINMPVMGGTQMADNIRAIKPDTKFIVLTGDTGQFIQDDSIGNGFAMDHYIVKPVDFEELFAAIDKCVSEIGDKSA